MLEYDSMAYSREDILLYCEANDYKEPGICKSYGGSWEKPRYLAFLNKEGNEKADFTTTSKYIYKAIVGYVGTFGDPGAIKLKEADLEVLRSVASKAAGRCSIAVVSTGSILVSTKISFENFLKAAAAANKMNREYKIRASLWSEEGGGGESTSNRKDCNNAFDITGVPLNISSSDLSEILDLFAKKLKINDFDSSNIVRIREEDSGETISKNRVRVGVSKGIHVKKILDLRDTAVKLKGVRATFKFSKSYVVPTPLWKIITEDDGILSLDPIFEGDHLRYGVLQIPDGIALAEYLKDFGEALGNTHKHSVYCNTRNKNKLEYLIGDTNVVYSYDLGKRTPIKLLAAPWNIAPEHIRTWRDKFSKLLEKAFNCCYIVVEKERISGVSEHVDNDGDETPHVVDSVITNNYRDWSY